MPNIELFAQRIQTAFDMPKYWTEAFQSAQKREEIVQVQTLASKILPEPTGAPERDSRPVITDGEILDYIQYKFGSETSNALDVLNCESSGNRYAYNPEEYAKQMGWTEWSSCGLFQINSPLCTEEDNMLYEPIRNIDEAFKKWAEKKDWSLWEVCKVKLGI